LDLGLVIANERRNIRKSKKRQRIVLISFIGLILFVWNMRREWSNSFSMIENKLKTSWIELNWWTKENREHTLYYHGVNEWVKYYVDIKLKNPLHIQKFQFIFIICRNSYSIFDATPIRCGWSEFLSLFFAYLVKFSELFYPSHITSYAHTYTYDTRM
jgi:hypothetical protein